MGRTKGLGRYAHPLLAAFHVGAALALYLPLTAFDPDHAPVFTWAGYATRYLPVVTLAGVILFAGLLLWHVHSDSQDHGVRFPRRA